MAQQLHAAKRQVWSERLRRFARSGLTAAEFCRREAIPAVSFYEWRRKLSPRRPATLASRGASSRPSFLPVEIVSPAGSGAPVEIHFSNGVRVRLTVNDPQLTAAAITAAAQGVGAERESDSC